MASNLLSDYNDDTPSLVPQSSDNLIDIDAPEPTSAPSKVMLMKNVLKRYVLRGVENIWYIKISVMVTLVVRYLSFTLSVFVCIDI